MTRRLAHTQQGEGDSDYDASSSSDDGILSSSDSDDDSIEYVPFSESDEEDDHFEDLRKRLCGSMCCRRIVKPVFLNIWPLTRRHLCILALIILVSSFSLLMWRAASTRGTAYQWSAMQFVQLYSQPFDDSGEAMQAPSHALVMEQRMNMCPPSMTRLLGVQDEILLGELVYTPVCSKNGDEHVYTALQDSAALPCADPYRHACGRWQDFFRGRADIYRLQPLGDDYYNVFMQRIAKSAFNCHKCATGQFADGARLAGYLMDTTEARLRVARMERYWRESLAFTTQEFFVQKTRESGVLDAIETPEYLCAMQAILRHVGPVPLQRLCDELKCAASVRQMVSALDQKLNVSGQCRKVSILVSRGAMGDGAVVQADVFGPVLHAIDFDSDRDTFLVVWRLSALMSRVAAVYSGRNPDNTGEVVHRIRVALPLMRETPFVGAHRTRLARVVFAETLEERLKEEVVDRYGRGPIRSLLSALQACSGTTFRMKEASHEQRSTAALCIGSVKSLLPEDAAMVVQLCTEAYRVAPYAPLQEAHIPSAVYVGGISETVLFTPALLAEPWMPKPVRSTERALAPLYYTLLGALVDKNNEYTVAQRDNKVLDMMSSCFSTLMNAPFWIELLQHWCSSSGQVTIAHKPVVFPQLKTSSSLFVNNRSESEHWREVLLQRNLYKNSFQCFSA